MELRHLRYFVAVAEKENISQAAKVLHVSQLALSRQMRLIRVRMSSAGGLAIDEIKPNTEESFGRIHAGICVEIDPEHLTSKEVQVLQFLVDRHSYKTAAYDMNSAVHAVSSLQARAVRAPPSTVAPVHLIEKVDGVGRTASRDMEETKLRTLHTLVAIGFFGTPLH